jgi:hypothetical protein
MGLCSRVIAFESLSRYIINWLHKKYCVFGLFYACIKSILKAFNLYAFALVCVEKSIAFILTIFAKIGHIGYYYLQEDKSMATI